MEAIVTILFFGFFLVFTWLLSTANSRRRVVALVVAGTMVAVLISPPPAQAQASLLAAIQSVLNAINGKIQTALNSINSVRSAISSSYQKLVWPMQLVNQARSLVTQNIGQSRRARNGDSRSSNKQFWESGDQLRFHVWSHSGGNKREPGGPRDDRYGRRRGT